MKLILTLFLLSCATGITAQVEDTSFQKVFYSGAGPYMARTLAGTSDDGAMILGDLEFGRSALTRIDSAGVQLWTKSYRSSLVVQNSNLQLRDMVRTHDSTYVSVGFAQSEGTGMSHLIVLKTDESGDTLWTTRFNKSTEAPMIGTAVHEGIDSSLLICGYGLQNNKAYVIKLDSLGNLLWDRELSDIGSLEPYGITQRSDGMIHLVGNRYTGAPTQQGFMATLDADGNVLSGLVMMDGSTDIIDHNGNLYLLGSYLNSITIIKMEYTGNVIWKKSYYYSSLLDYSRKTYLRTLSNGNLMIMYGDRWFSTHLMVLNTDGDILEQQNIMWGGIDALETEKKGLLMVGYGPLYGLKMLQFDHTGVARIDSLYNPMECSWGTNYAPTDANIQFGSLNVSATSALIKATLELYYVAEELSEQLGCVEIWGGLEENAGHRMTASPNPAMDVVHFEQADGIRFSLIVMELNGRILYQEENTSLEKHINLSAFGTGVYVYRVQFEDGTFNHGKLVVE